MPNNEFVGLQKYKDKDGNVNIMYPVTKGEAIMLSDDTIENLDIQGYDVEDALKAINSRAAQSGGSIKSIQIGNVDTAPAGSNASASVSNNGDTATLNLTIPKGDKGDSAGFGTPTATINNNTGTPSVTVTASGSDTSKVFNFAFKNLKGEKGEPGTASSSSESAAKLTTARNINGVAFDGTKDITVPRSSKTLHQAGRNQNGTGYIKIADIELTGTNTDMAMEITYSQRYNIICYAYIMFKRDSVGNSSINKFLYYCPTNLEAGNNLYLFRESDTLYHLYIKKVHTSDYIDIIDFKLPAYLADRSILTWSDELVSSLPSGYVEAAKVFSTFDNTKNGLVPKSDNSTTKFLRADGEWSTPVSGVTSSDVNSAISTATSDMATKSWVNSQGFKTTDNNTTYTFASGDSNGQIKVTPSGGSAQNVSVKGLGSAAYTASTAYASSNHSHTYSDVGAAAASHSHNGYASSTHTHNYAGSSSAGGAATYAVELYNDRTINGVVFNGTQDITIPRSSKSLHSTTATGTGYIKIASINFTGVGTDMAFEMTYSQRWSRNNHIFFGFSRDNTSSTTTVSRFSYRDAAQNNLYYPPYLYKVSNTLFYLYVKKVSSADTIHVTDLKIPAYLDSRISITWENEVTSSLPSTPVSITAATSSDSCIEPVRQDGAGEVLYNSVANSNSVNVDVSNLWNYYTSALVKIQVNSKTDYYFPISLNYLGRSTSNVMSYTYDGITKYIKFQKSSTANRIVVSLNDAGTDKITYVYMCSL